MQGEGGEGGKGEARAGFVEAGQRKWAGAGLRHRAHAVRLLLRAGAGGDFLDCVLKGERGKRDEGCGDLASVSESLRQWGVGGDG